jgi:CubicO group peptidase (beta-lactamase class C family)
VDSWLWIGAAALLAAAIWLFGLAIRTGGGYKAKVLSTILFTQQRDVDPERAVEISDDSYAILRLFRATVNRQTHTVTTSFFGLVPQTAEWQPGSGSTLSFASAPVPRPPSVRRQSGTRLPRHPATTGPLNDAVARAFSEPNPRRLRRTRAVLVVQGGSVVAERYAHGFGPDDLFAGWSVAKSVAPALIGILVGEGRLSLEDRELWPGWERDTRADITIEDLLRMRSGLRFSEVYGRPWSDVLRMLYREPDMAAYAASLPHIARAGRRWSYSSGTTNILSAIVKRAVGEHDYPAWPRRMLFDRIGMASALLEADAAGTFVLSSYMLATVDDWARWGLLHARDGVWEGTRILPEGWLHFCRTPTPQSDDGRYGAHWLLKLNADIGGASPAAARLPPDAFFAIGHEGQTLTVVPSLDLVIVRHGVSIYIDAWNQAQFVADIIDAL